MYFALEMALTKANFTMNDRSLFEKRFARDSATKPSTDLILELVDYKQVNYYTNKVIPESAKDGSEYLLPKYFYFKGAEAQFKVTRIQTNEIVATFVLNYTPCLKGCKVKYNDEGYMEEVDGDFKIRKKNGDESTDRNENFEMFNELSKRLVLELRAPYENKQKN